MHPPLQQIVEMIYGEAEREGQGEMQSGGLPSGSGGAGGGCSLGLGGAGKVAARLGLGGAGGGGWPSVSGDALPSSSAERRHRPTQRATPPRRNRPTRTTRTRGAITLSAPYCQQTAPDYTPLSVPLVVVVSKVLSHSLHTCLLLWLLLMLQSSFAAWRRRR